MSGREVDPGLAARVTKVALPCSWDLPRVAVVVWAPASRRPVRKKEVLFAFFEGEFCALKNLAFCFA